MGSWTRKLTGSVNPNSVLAFHRTRAETTTAATEHHTLHHIPVRLLEHALKDCLANEVSV